MIKTNRLRLYIDYADLQLKNGVSGVQTLKVTEGISVKANSSDTIPTKAMTILQRKSVRSHIANGKPMRNSMTTFVWNSLESCLIEVKLCRKRSFDQTNLKL